MFTHNNTELWDAVFSVWVGAHTKWLSTTLLFIKTGRRAVARACDLDHINWNLFDVKVIDFGVGFTRFVFYCWARKTIQIQVGHVNKINKNKSNGIRGFLYHILINELGTENYPQTTPQMTFNCTTIVRRKYLI